MNINLIVIKTNKLEEQKELYSLFGLNFKYHRHGNGPYHYSTISNDIVFEIYPLLDTQKIIDTTTRLGFEVENLDSVLKTLTERKIPIINSPQNSNYGRIAVILDYDGRKIELKDQQKYND